MRLKNCNRIIHIKTSTTEMRLQCLDQGHRLPPPASVAAHRSASSCLVVGEAARRVPVRASLAPTPPALVPNTTCSGNTVLFVSVQLSLRRVRESQVFGQWEAKTSTETSYFFAVRYTAHEKCRGSGIRQDWTLETPCGRMPQSDKRTVTCKTVNER